MKGLLVFAAGTTVGLAVSGYLPFWPFAVTVALLWIAVLA